MGRNMGLLLVCVLLNLPISFPTDLSRPPCSGARVLEHRVPAVRVRSETTPQPADPPASGPPAGARDRGLHHHHQSPGADPVPVPAGGGGAAL